MGISNYDYTKGADLTPSQIEYVEEVKKQMTNLKNHYGYSIITNYQESSFEMEFTVQIGDTTMRFTGAMALGLAIHHHKLQYDYYQGKANDEKTKTGYYYSLIEAKNELD